MARPLALPATLTAGTPQNVNDLNSNLSAIVTEFNAAIPQVRATSTAATSLSTATLTMLPMEAETYDTGTPSNNMHDTSTNNSRLICRVAGLYLIVGTATYTANATGGRGAAIKLNGTTYISETFVGNCGASVETSVTTTSVYRLAVNDYVELFGYQNSGGSLALVSTIAGSASISATLMSA